MLQYVKQKSYLTPVTSIQLVHSKVVDTSVVFPHRLGPPYKRALRTLTAEFLKQIIQDDGEDKCYFVLF